MRISDWSSDVCSSDLLDRLQVLPAQLDLQRRGKAEELRATEVDLRARMPLHRRAQLLGFRRLQLLAAAIGHHHGQLADVLAALGGAGVQARAAATDAVQGADALVVAVPGLQLAHKLVGLAPRRTRSEQSREGK